MAYDHPFQNLFESFGRPPVSHADSVNRVPYQNLLSTLSVGTENQGRCILLKAPRAGHGKTHLLSRTQNQLSGTHEFIPLHASGGRVGAMSVTEDTLDRLTRALPATGGLTVLDLVIRRLFAFALQPLVVSGEVPCQDREGALAALRTRPVETFDFHHPNAVTAHWARDNFDVLGPRLSMELAQRCGRPVREISFWVTVFFRYASTPIDHPGRARELGLDVAGEPVSEGTAMERLVSLLALLTVLMRVVLVADDLEGFSADETAALAFAAFIGSIRQHAERVDIIVSLNEDVWKNAFLPRLSGGLADRLSEVLIELEPLKDEDVIALFDSRAPGLGQQVFERVEPSKRHARGLIQAAGLAWVKAVKEREEAASAPAPVAAPAVAEVKEEGHAADEEAEEVLAGKGEAEAVELQEAEDEVLTAAAVADAPGDDAHAGDFAAIVEEAPADFVQERLSASEGESFGDGAFQVQKPADYSATDTPPVVEVEQGEVAQADEIETVVVAPTPWSGGAVFDAQVVDEPVESEPFSGGPTEDHLAGQASPFQASPFQAAPNQEQDAFSGNYGSAVFGSTPASPGFGPPPPPLPDAPPQAAADGDERVDDLLKQFRDRYGR